MDDLSAQLEPPVAGTEVESLVGELDRLRGYLLWKCGGLDADGIRATLGPSTVTLGGLLKHLAAVEATHFTWKLHGRAPFPPYDVADWDGDPDWHWRVEADDTPETLEAQWREAVEQARRLLAEAIEDRGLDGAAGFTWPDGRRPNVRRLVLDMIEEYGRHVGHADLIRESVDGLVGEDPPGERRQL